MSSITEAELAALLQQTADRHHDAFIGSDGADPDWALCPRCARERDAEAGEIVELAKATRGAALITAPVEPMPARDPAALLSWAGGWKAVRARGRSVA